MWILQLNDMRAAKVEIPTLVAKADTREALVSFVGRQRVEPYRDGPWGKCFRQGGPLEWYNDESGFFRSYVDMATEDDWRKRAAERWHEILDPLPYVSD